MLATMTFKTGSLLHIGCLVTLALMSYLLVRSTKKMRRGGRKDFMRYFVGYGCIGVWIMNTVYHASAEVFSDTFDLTTRL